VTDFGFAPDPIQLNLDQQSPVLVEGIQHAAEAHGVASPWMIRGEFEHVPDLVEAGTAFPDPAALVARVPETVVRVGEEGAPEAEGLCRLTWPQAGPFKPGERNPAMG
jgi:hypothetical protein